MRTYNNIGTPALTLLELNGLVRQVVERAFTTDYWVEAELSELRENRGHCYMELVQKDALSATPVARASARCWRTQWTVLQPYFERATGQQLHAGMKVKLRVHPQFHEAYGFSWIVTDIDPTFTLGDMARKRQEIVARLREEGIFDMQRELCLPLFCQRVAVISSGTAAGYGDFVAQLEGNALGLQFQARLFTAVMQGEQVEQSIIDALNRIYQAGADEAFDCVVIIRGGGGTADMSGFDTLALAENVAQFPLPIITGIGHDRDESVLDMVSFMRVKTPTAAAQVLIDHLAQVLHRVEHAEQQLATLAGHHLQAAQLRLDALARHLPTLFSLVRSRQEGRLDRLARSLALAVGQRIERERSLIDTRAYRLQALPARLLLTEDHRLSLLQQRAAALDPQLILNRGYSITLLHGKALTSAAQARPGDLIKTLLNQGTITSRIEP